MTAFKFEEAQAIIFENQSKSESSILKYITEAKNIHKHAQELFELIFTRTNKYAVSTIKNPFKEIGKSLSLISD